MTPAEPRAGAAPPLRYDESFETPEPDENETGCQISTTLAGIGDITFTDTGLGLRSVHAKGQGILRGELRIFELPLPFAQGLFATPQTLPAGHGALVNLAGRRARRQGFDAARLRSEGHRRARRAPARQRGRDDARLSAPEDQSPFVPVARLTVEPQNVWDAQAAASLDERLSFSLWHGLAAHRPLGAVNRVRWAAYRTSTDARSARSGCPIHEPSLP
jgi:hypothetical protein